MTAPVTFTGITYADAGDITISRGITPSVALVRMLPQASLTLAVADLAFTDGTTTVTFPDCLPLQQTLKKVRVGKSWRWTIEILDRRWKWELGSITGHYNKRLSNGEVDNASEKTPRELCDLLLQAMGETGYDVSAVPEDVRPLVKWERANPARALASLCEKLALEISGGETGAVVIEPTGTGAAMPTGGERHGDFSYTPPVTPSRVVAYGGGTTFQTKLKLQAVALESDGDLVPIDSADYKPVTWSGELPFSFPSLAAANQPFAFTSMYRYWRVQAQADGTLPVPGQPVGTIINGVWQYLPLAEYLVEAGADPDLVKWTKPAYLEGVWWNYSDDSQNLSATARYAGPFQIVTDRGLVILPFPLFKLGASGTFEAADLWLVTSYQVRDRDGTLLAASANTAITGGTGGDLILRIPECFGAVTAAYTGTAVSGTTSTVTDAETELGFYCTYWKTKLEAGLAIDDQEFLGIKATLPDGKIAQTQIRAAYGDPVKTRISIGAEFEIHAPSAAERRRQQVLAQLKELALL